MDGWRLVGRALLATVDALAAGLLAAFLAYLLVPVVWVSTRVELAAVVGGLVTGILLAVALALASLGRRPFPATRLVTATANRVPWWI